MSQETAKSKRARLAQELAMEEIAEFIESHGFYITEINQNSVVFLIPTFTPSGEEGELRAIAHSYKEARELLGY